MDPVSAISNGLSGIFQILPQLGIGSKSRKKEIAAMGEAQGELAEQQSKATTKILVISGVMIFIVLIIFLTLRKK